MFNIEDLRNAWYVAAWSKDVVTSKPFAITVLNQPLVLWRTTEDELVVLEDRCLHKNVPLSIGRCEGATLRCIYHGMLYDPKGAVIEIPGQDRIPPRAQLRSFPAVERYGWVWVWVGDADRADASAIPQVLPLDAPEYHLGTGQFDFDARASLIRDNLLDFSHLPFLHSTTFGLSETWARTQPTLIEFADGLQYRRWVEDQHAMLGSDERVDVWSVFEFRIPGIVMMRNAQYPAGTAAASGRGAPDPSLPGKNITATSQAVTPMTDRTTRYFFSWGPHRTCGDESVRDMLLALADKAFTEDKIVIEAQQKMFERAPETKLLGTKSDAGANYYNKLVALRLRGERGS